MGAISLNWLQQDNWYQEEQKRQFMEYIRRQNNLYSFNNTNIKIQKTPISDCKCNGINRKLLLV